MAFWNKKKPVEIEPKEEMQPSGFFSTNTPVPRTIEKRKAKLQQAIDQTFQKTDKDFVAHNPDGTVAMDGIGRSGGKVAFGSFSFGGVPEAQVAWYGSQGFIGYQMCAMISQNWLIDKACTIPARDAIRNGFTTTVNDGTEVKPEVMDAITEVDKRMKLNENMLQFIRLGRIFGIRILMFKVDSADPKYYEYPFNIDAVKPGTYRGMAQIDPYWITPELDEQSISDPTSQHFYEPTWWRVNGVRIHRTHLCIFKTNEVPDVLKPSYLYGGISIPQKIYERVYAAERTANEAPLLAMTKRLNVRKIDIANALQNQVEFEQKIEWQDAMRNNFGTLFADIDESVEQLDTSLTDLDETIMTQFQIVSSASNVPATKLLGTAPKGLNATGEFDEASYHEELESLQAHDLTPLVDRHHALVIVSEIMPAFKIKAFSTTVTWEPVDSPTAKELAEMNYLKSQTAANESLVGAIDGRDERTRLINDPDSGYSGMEDEKIEEENPDDNDLNPTK